MNNFFIDMHCHPTLKPFGRSFGNDNINSRNSKHRHSAWHYDPPRFRDKLLNYITTLTRFTQSDFSALSYGGARVICASLYAPEIGFFDNNIGDGKLSDSLLNIVTGFSRERINFIQANNDYFGDLEREYAFLRQLDSYGFPLGDGKYQYKLAKNFNEIELALGETPVQTISVVLTVEGAHVFNCGLDPVQNPADKNEVFENVDKMKQWDHPVFFISLAHHFYNELCGHAESLTPLSSKFIDQYYKMNTGITDLGREVIHRLLDEDNGKRIFIDIKHMSPLSRREYFQILDESYASEDIPIIASHAAVNGLISLTTPKSGLPHSAGKFSTSDINFFDEELVRIARSNGIIGLQMDERRVGSRAEIKKASGRLARKKILFHRSKLLWNQVQHIAEVLDSGGMFAWGNISLGTDFDGIINPLNGYWSAESLPFLDDFLLMHAYNYRKAHANNGMKHAFNRIDPEEIVSRIMSDNAYAFLQRYFR